MNQKLFITIIILLGLSLEAFTQTIPLRGVVKSANSGNLLKDANIIVTNLNKGCTTNAQGEFTLDIPEGKHKIRISSVGYEMKKLNINTKKLRGQVEILLTESITGLDEMQITQRVLKKQGEVTAKINVAIKDVPITVSSVSKTLLEQTLTSNINDALKYATGITPQVNYGGFQTFTLRGFGAPVIMVDGARDERMNFANSAPLTSLASVERVEYLKGPASVLYGHSAVGGIINIVRKQPTKNFTGSAKATYGSWDKKSIQAGAGGSINEKLTYRFDANVSDSKGWRDNTMKYANAYLALDYDLNIKDDIEFRFGVNDDFYGTDTGLPTIKQDKIYNLKGNVVYQKGDFPKGMHMAQRYNDPADFLKHKNFNASLKYTHEFSQQSKLSFHTIYSDDIIDYFSTEELSYQQSDKPIYDNYFITDDTTKTYIDLQHLVRSYPLRFSHETTMYQSYLDYNHTFYAGSLKHNMLLGYYFAYVDRTSFKGYNVKKDGSGDVFGPGILATINVEKPMLNQGYIGTKFSSAAIYNELVNGIYAQDILEITDQLKAMVGFRYDYYLMNSRSANVLKGRTKTDISEKSTIVNLPVSIRGGLVYQPSKTLSCYASYANFFKPKRTTYSKNNIYIDKDGKEFFPADGKEVFKPERGFQLEGGFKYDMSKKLQLNTSVYYIKKNNIVQYIDKDSVTDKYIYAQIGVVDSKGVDVELLWNPTKGLSINTGYGFIQAKYQSFSTNKYSANSNEGNYLPFNPKHKAYFWGNYIVQRGVLKNFSLGAGVNYCDENFFNPSNTIKADSYFVSDLAIGYQLNRLSLKFKLNNVFDEVYYNSAVYSTQFVPREERNFLIGVGYKF